MAISQTIKGILQKPKDEEKDEKITMSLNGQQYEDFVNASVVKNLTEVAGGFSFKLTDRNNDGIPFKADDKVEIFIDGEKIITGYIMLCSGKISNSSSFINITGNDLTIDFVDSELSSNISFSSSDNSLEYQYLNDLKIQPVLTGNFNLVDIIKKVLTNINLNVKINLQKGLSIPNFTKEENIAGKSGEKAFAFCEQYARKRGVVITTDRNGDILIQKSTNIYNKDILQFILEDETNNVLSSSYKESFKNKFYKYTARCSQNLSLGIFDNNSTNKVVTIYNNQIRKSRQKEIVMDANSTSTLRKRLIWQKNFDLNDDLYSCKVKSFRSNTDTLWHPNMLVDVIDEKWGIKKRLLVKRCEWTFSGEGTFTNMILVDPIAFSDFEDYKYNFKTNEIKKKLKNDRTRNNNK